MNKKTENWIKLMKIGRWCGCHQRADRSFFFNGYQMPVCARCTGIIIGRMIGLLAPIQTKKKHVQYYYMFIPLIIDGVTQLLGFQKSNNSRRLLTGVLFGTGESIIIKHLLKTVSAWINA
jgi:uncharacterized membrane protein